MWSSGRSGVALNSRPAVATVSIRTRIETVKKELREGFDVVVFDADSGHAQSVGVMSGGEIARHHLYGYTGVLTVFTTPG